MKLFTFLCISFYSSIIFSRSLDKISLVFNENAYTTSQLQRIQNSVKVRKNISPLIYNKDQFTLNEVAEKIIQRNLVLLKLTELGQNASDDYVDSRIKQNEKSLGVSRQSMTQLLEREGFSFEEYFETVREATNYSTFVQRVIVPIVSVTDQEVKNAYYKENSKSARMNFKYTVIDYSIEEDINKGIDFSKAILQHRKTNTIPEDFKTFSQNTIDDISEESISPELNTVLKSADEGQLSKPLMIGNVLHVYFVQKKDLVETEDYQAAKEKIKNQLYEKAIVQEMNDWFSREKVKHFIKINL